MKTDSLIEELKTSCMKHLGNLKYISERKNQQPAEYEIFLTIIQSYDTHRCKLWCFVLTSPTFKICAEVAEPPLSHHRNSELPLHKLPHQQHIRSDFLFTWSHLLLLVYTIPPFYRFLPCFTIYFFLR